GSGSGTFSLGAGIVLSAVETQTGRKGVGVGDCAAFGSQSISFDNSAGADGDIVTTATRNASLTPVNDRFLEGSETVVVTLGAPLVTSGTATTFGNTSNTTTITDDESATVAIAATSTALEAAAGAQTVGVVTLTISGSGSGTFSLGAGIVLSAVETQ